MAMSKDLPSSDEMHGEVVALRSKLSSIRDCL